MPDTETPNEGAMRFIPANHDPFPFHLPAEIEAEVAKMDKPSLHIITAPGGMCLCGVRDGKEFICDDHIRKVFTTVTRERDEARKLHERTNDVLMEAELRESTLRQQLAEAREEAKKATAFASGVERGEVKFAEHVNEITEQIAKLLHGEKRLNEDLAQTVQRVLQQLAEANQRADELESVNAQLREALMQASHEIASWRRECDEDRSRHGADLAWENNYEPAYVDAALSNPDSTLVAGLREENAKLNREVSLAKREIDGVLEYTSPNFRIISRNDHPYASLALTFAKLNHAAEASGREIADLRDNLRKALNDADYSRLLIDDMLQCLGPQGEEKPLVCAKRVASEWKAALAQVEEGKKALARLLTYHPEDPETGAELPKENWTQHYREAVETAQALLAPAPVSATPEIQPL